MTKSAAAVSKILQRAARAFAKLRARRQSDKAGDRNLRRKAAEPLPSHNLKPCRQVVGKNSRAQPGKKVKHSSENPRPSAHRKCDPKSSVSRRNKGGQKGEPGQKAQEDCPIISTPPERGADWDRPTPDARAVPGRGQKRGRSSCQDKPAVSKKARPSVKQRVVHQKQKTEHSHDWQSTQRSPEGVLLLLSTTSRKALSTSQHKHLQKMGAKLLEEDEAAIATHVVVTDRVLRRTFRVMCAFCRGQRVMQFDWLLESLRTRRWISEVGYELIPEGRAAQTASTCRNYTGGFLMGRSVYVYPSVSERSVLESIVLAAGGTVLRRRHHAGPDNVILIGSKTDRLAAHRQTWYSPELLFEGAMSQQLCEWGHKL